MSNETPVGSTGIVDQPRQSEESSGRQSPLQRRDLYLRDRNWEFVIQLNREVCDRSRAQHGLNSETHDATAREWSAKENVQSTLDETIDFLHQCRRRAPFLFENDATFSEIGRRIAVSVCIELSHTRRREITSAVAHNIVGNLDRGLMVQIVEELSSPIVFSPGDRVKTLRGSMSGTILGLLPDGRVVWLTDSGVELTALREALLTEAKA